MRFIRGLTQETIKILGRIYQQSKYHQVRQRAQCISLSYEGYQIKELMKIFNVSRLTIYHWFNDWENKRLAGLYDRKGRGRNPKLNPEQKEQVKKWAKEHRNNLDKVRKKVSQKWRIQISKDTIKRVLLSNISG